MRPLIIPQHGVLFIGPQRRNFLLILVSRNCALLKTKVCLLLNVMGINGLVFFFAPSNMKFREIFMLHWKQILDFYIRPFILFYIFILHFLLVYESLKKHLKFGGRGQNETNGESALMHHKNNCLFKFKGSVKKSHEKSRGRKDLENRMYGLKK